MLKKKKSLVSDLPRTPRLIGGAWLSVCGLLGSERILRAGILSADGGTGAWCPWEMV